jgi:mRNA interferase MazF
VGLGESLCWVVMITSAENRPWPGDVPFGDGYADAGLPAPSVVRSSKVATVDISRLEPLGRVSSAMLFAVDDKISRIIRR